MFINTREQCKGQGSSKKERGKRGKMLLRRVGLKEERTLFFSCFAGQKGNKWAIEKRKIRRSEKEKKKGKKEERRRRRRRKKERRRK